MDRRRCPPLQQPSHTTSSSQAQAQLVLSVTPPTPTSPFIPTTSSSLLVHHPHHLYQPRPHPPLPPRSHPRSHYDLNPVTQNSRPSHPLIRRPRSAPGLSASSPYHSPLGFGSPRFLSRRRTPAALVALGATMSFAIESAGVNPLSYQALCQALQSATTSLDYVQRQAAEQQLQEWQTQAGYYSSLQTVYLDKSLALEPRYQAIIQLKNGIERHWRLYAQVQNGVKPEEKSIIRSRLFQGTIEETEDRLAKSNALVVAKIIRIDYPADWPEALPKIIELLREATSQNNQQQLYGTLQILLQVVKELGSARLRKSQTALQSVTPELVHVVCQVFSERSGTGIGYIQSHHDSNQEDAYRSLSIGLLALKILRRLVIVGFERPHMNEAVSDFWSLSQAQFGQLLTFVNQESSLPAEFHKIAGDYLLQFTKLHINMSEHHAASFAVLPNTLNLIHAYWGLVSKCAEVFAVSGGIRQSSGGAGDAGSKADGPLLEKLAVKALLLFRACIRIAFQPMQTFKYRSPETKAEQETAKAIIKEQLFTHDMVKQMVNCIISYLFMFRKSDLEAWDEDPVDWEKEQQSEGDAYEWQVRPCAEKLFLDLLTNFRDLLIPPLLSYFQSAQDPNADIATKEAVYTAMGLSAAHIVDKFDFHSFLVSTISQDATQTGGLYRVLRRRIAILLSQWAPVKFEDATRPVVYHIYQHFLSPNDETNDIVVRITAARQLRWIADELLFSVEAFLPYTSDVLGQLTALIDDVEIDDTKLAILESIRIIVTRMEEQVSQFGDQLMSSLPGIWSNSGSEEYMIQQAIIAIFSALVMSMGNSSQRYHGLMVPLITEALKPGSDLHVHLIDESLELWNAILMQSTAPISLEIVNLAEFALPLLEYASETAAQALTALESYILLAPSSMLEDRLRRPTLVALLGALDSRSREQVRLGTVCIEYLIRSAVELGGPSGVSVIIQDLVETGFMRKILENLHNAFEAHQTTGPNRKISKLNTITQGDYFAIVARIALAEPTLFTQMLMNFGPIDQVWNWLSSEWFSYLRDCDNITRQKLYLLALTRLVELPSPMQDLVLSKLQDFFDMWADVCAELSDGEPSGTDSLIWQTIEPEEYDTPKTITEREMSLKDPVHSIHALSFVRERIQDLVARVGGEAAFEQWSANVDKDVMDRFGHIVRGTQ